MNVLRREFYKNLIIRILRFFLRLFCIIPIKKKIVFASFQGKQFSCNPKYIFLSVYEKYGNKIEYVWCLNKKSAELEAFQNVKTCKFMSLSFFYHVLTSSVYISNLAIEPFLPKRKKQLFINTWHGGGAYKKFHVFFRNNIYLTEREKYRAKITDYVISSCQAFTDANNELWCMPKEKFIPVGMPRNDFLVNHSNDDKLFQKLRSKYSIPENKKVILYAPTFRGVLSNNNASNQKEIQIDINSIVLSAKKRFESDFIVLYRCHQSMLGKNIELKNMIDVSQFDDTQEVLMISDILITDYSSIIWDYALLNRPCFLFTPDLDEYSNENGFFTPIEKWAFKYSKTNDELCKLIDSFDEEKNFERIREHQKMMGSFETGNAGIEIINRIDKILEVL